MVLHKGAVACLYASNNKPLGEQHCALYSARLAQYTRYFAIRTPRISPAFRSPGLVA